MFPGGALRASNHILATLTTALLPGSTVGHTRNAIRERFDLLGARVSVQSGATNLFVHLAVRKAVLHEAFTLLCEMLGTPTFPHNEYREVYTHLHTALLHAKEDTATVAQGTALRAVYKKGHPHYMPKGMALVRELDLLTPALVRQFYRETFSTVGSLVCFTGDISSKQVMTMMRNATKVLPAHAPARTPVAHSDRVQVPKQQHSIIPVRGKMNVDVRYLLPLTVTNTHADYRALALAVSVLGGGSTGRLFHVLRNQKSLTYDARATFAGSDDGYPGYISAATIFPNDVYLKGQKEMEQVIASFVTRGITSIELRERKEEIIGKYKVALSTTEGVAHAVFHTLRIGKPLSEIDEYSERIQVLTVREVNRVIAEHLDPTLGAYAAAGSITKKGRPMV